MCCLMDCASVFEFDEKFVENCEREANSAKGRETAREIMERRTFDVH